MKYRLNEEANGCTAIRYVLLSCAAVLMLGACAKGAEKPKRPPALIDVQPAQPMAFADSVDAVGTALANEQVVLAAPVTQRKRRCISPMAAMWQKGR